LAHTWADINGQELIPLRDGLRLSIDIQPAAPIPPLPADAQRLWQQRCAANPRLHDGNILAVSSIDEATGKITCIRDRFQRLASQGEGVDLGVRLLGVKGLVIARDSRGTEHVLIARRGRQTRIYGDMWEIAPAGGIDMPPPEISQLDESHIVRAVIEEGHEELGMQFDASTARPVAIVRDEVAHSVDIIVRVDWAEVIDPQRAACRTDERSWEYSDSAWLARSEARTFDQRSAAAIVGPMRAVLRWMGWA
jgi:hypothetical protein